MKKLIRIIGTLLAIVKLSTASTATEDPFLSEAILKSVQNIRYCLADPLHQN